MQGSLRHVARVTNVKPTKACSVPCFSVYVLRIILNLLGEVTSGRQSSCFDKTFLFIHVGWFPSPTMPASKSYYRYPSATHTRECIFKPVNTRPERSTQATCRRFTLLCERLVVAILFFMAVTPESFIFSAFYRISHPLLAALKGDLCA